MPWGCARLCCRLICTNIGQWPKRKKEGEIGSSNNVQCSSIWIKNCMNTNIMKVIFHQTKHDLTDHWKSHQVTNVFKNPLFMLYFPKENKAYSFTSRFFLVCLFVCLFYENFLYIIYLCTTIKWSSMGKGSIFVVVP